MLIAIGGDGSLDIIYTLAQKGGWNLIGIPKTIDNDVPFTERSVGFDTAIQTVTTAPLRPHLYRRQPRPGDGWWK